MGEDGNRQFEGAGFLEMLFIFRHANPTAITCIGLPHSLVCCARGLGHKGRS